MVKEHADLLHEYEEQKRIIKEATARLDEIKDEVKKIVPEDGVDMGTATIDWSLGKPRWKYSQKIGEMELELKDKQQEERQTGVAEKVYGDPFLICTLK